MTSEHSPQSLVKEPERARVSQNTQLTSVNLSRSAFGGTSRWQKISESFSGNEGGVHGGRDI